MNTKRLTHSAALGLALAALAVPAASASQDLRNPDQVTPSELVAPAPRQDLRSPDAIDAAAGRGTDASPDVMVVKVPVETPSASPADGLDWQDAGVGAGALFALGMIGLGGTLLVVHHRRATVPTPGVR
jgi:hypothetical protein